MTDELSLNPNVIIDGISYFYNPAHQLAKYICKQNYDEFRLTYKSDFISATIYFEKILQLGGHFVGAKYGEKRCIGTLFYNIETNLLTLEVADIKSFKFQDQEFFGVQYEIFKYLRESDLIRICTTERKDCHKMNLVYKINKLKAIKCGKLLTFEDIDTQFFIPKTNFVCLENKTHKKRRRKR